MENRKYLEKQQKAISDMETRADVMAVAFEGANYDENYKTERQKLISNTYPTQVQLKKWREISRSLKRN